MRGLARDNGLSRNGSATRKIAALAAADPRYRRLRNLALVDLLFATGMRVGEVSSLNVEDFLAEDAVFKVLGKGGRDRLAFRSTKHARHSARVSAAQTGNSNRKPGAVPERAWRAIVYAGDQRGDRAAAQSCRDQTPYNAAHVAAYGGDAAAAQWSGYSYCPELLGHASIATMQRYTHITKEHLIGALRKHHPSLTLCGKQR